MVVLAVAQEVGAGAVAEAVILAAVQVVGRMLVAGAAADLIMQEPVK
jgi:hypothetical protein